MNLPMILPMIYDSDIELRYKPLEEIHQLYVNEGYDLTNYLPIAMERAGFEYCGEDADLALYKKKVVHGYDIIFGIYVAQAKEQLNVNGEYGVAWVDILEVENDTITRGDLEIFQEALQMVYECFALNGIPVVKHYKKYVKSEFLRRRMRQINYMLRAETQSFVDWHLTDSKVDIEYFASFMANDDSDETRQNNNTLNRILSNPSNFPERWVEKARAFNEILEKYEQRHRQSARDYRNFESQEVAKVKEQEKEEEELFI